MPFSQSSGTGTLFPVAGRKNTAARSRQSEISDRLKMAPRRKNPCCRASIRSHNAANAPFRKNLLFRAVRQVVQHDDRRNFLVKGVMQALLMVRNHIFAILGYNPIANPIRVCRQPRNFFVLHGDFEQAHRAARGPRRPPPPNRLSFSSALARTRWDLLAR